MRTPYLKPFNTEGGTLYVFPSVSNDLTKTFVSSDYEFKFSHFACLNIPDIYSYVDEDENTKGLYIDKLMKENNSNSYENVRLSSNEDIQNCITENLQNYVMNFETAILNGEGDNDDYDPEILTTVSEKVFWNWLQKVGGIKFNDTDTLEDYASYADRTVQYIGNIDIMNTVEINGEAFEELYIHIPSTVGASTSVYFRTGDMTDNKNYLNKNYVISNGEYSPENIIGRDESQTTFGLSTKAIYDIENEDIYTGDIGHTIDFRDSSYSGGDGISAMNSNSLEDFQFNAVLLYYDMFEKTSTPDVRRVSTNLYGILFLDQVTPISGNGAKGYIQRYPKKKETVYGNGNSYALKIDFKIETFADANCEYKIVVPSSNSSDPNNWNNERVVSMMHYVKSLIQLQQCIDFFFTQKNELVKLTDRVATLENLVLGIDTVASLKEDIERLYGLCDGNSIVDTSALLGLIDANSKKLDNIMNGGKDLKLQFDTDVIQPGTGIGIERPGLNKVIINSEQKYSINTVYNGDGSSDTENGPEHLINTSSEAKLCTIPLKPGENFAVIYINDDGDSPSNFKINIDDSEYGWSVGQSMKLFFVCETGGSLNFEDKTATGINIRPSRDKSLSISGSEFEGNNLIEIVCVAEGRFIYSVVILTGIRP